MSDKPSVENWEEEFDKKFPDITHTSCAEKSFRCGTMANDVKSFIRSLRTKWVKEAMVSECELLLSYIEAMPLFDGALEVKEVACETIRNRLKALKEPHT